MSRQEDNLLAYPCIHRGKFFGIESRSGPCSVEPAPSFMCNLPSNKLERCTLWRFSTTQELPICNRCNDRVAELKKENS